MSIRWRLTLWNTLAVAALLIVCGALVYWLLRRAMLDQTDRLLASQFAELQNDPRMSNEYKSRIPYWVREFKEHVNVFAVVYDADGSVFTRTEELAVGSLPPFPRDAAPESEFVTMRLPIVGPQRVLTARISPANRQLTVLLMSPLEEMEAELGQVLTVLLTALPIALVLAGGMGYWLARRSLQPVEQLREQADRITAERLEQRLPVDHPDDELGRLTQTINHMLARLERSFQEIRRFTADASHELRTPLAVLRTEVEVALRKQLDPTEQHRVLTSVLEECQRLTYLTEQLLHMSREDAGIAPHSQGLLSLTALVRDVVETMTPLAEAKGLTISFDGGEEARVMGDAARLRRVFYNVLDNSIKYTPERGDIAVVVSSQERTVRAVISDSGIGIPAEHLPQVFERFYRVDKARSRAQGGAGLGLSIARSIIVAHEGHIELRSTPGKGTTCTVTLPRAEAIPFRSDDPGPGEVRRPDAG